MSENLPARSLRAGDSERTQTVDRLSAGYQQGMLTLEEFTERMERAWQSMHLAELDALVADLPATTASPKLPALNAVGSDLERSRVVGGSGVPVTFALMSGATRAGEWTAAGTHTAVAIMGGVDLDLREACFTQPQTTVLAFAIMGGIDVIVPPDVRVRVHGLPIMGGFDAEGSINPVNLPANAPVVTIQGVAVMGGVTVKRRAYDEDAD
ncbi:DUF1707 domain-containing protein [Luteococcus sp. H138]|uniref:DUF1707 SHOCT-like domain-containing protein n=1 Tax=unclassified Luteococcus TaxID=2639923 RepID=UPI00313E1E95